MLPKLLMEEEFIKFHKEGLELAKSLQLGSCLRMRLRQGRGIFLMLGSTEDSKEQCLEHSLKMEDKLDKDHLHRLSTSKSETLKMMEKG